MDAETVLRLKSRAVQLLGSVDLIHQLSCLEANKLALYQMLDCDLSDKPEETAKTIDALLDEAADGLRRSRLRLSQAASDLAMAAGALEPKRQFEMNKYWYGEVKNG